MNCESTKLLIDLKAHYGDAPPEGLDFAALDRHLASCPACRAELDSLLRTRDALAAIADESPTTEEKNRMLLAIESAAAADLKPSWPARLRGAGQLAAACIAVAAVLTVALQVGQTRYRGKSSLLSAVTLSYDDALAPDAARFKSAAALSTREGAPAASPAPDEAPAWKTDGRAPAKPSRGRADEQFEPSTSPVPAPPPADYGVQVGQPFTPAEGASVAGDHSYRYSITGDFADQSPAAQESAGLTAAVTEDGKRLSTTDAYWMLVRSGDVTVKQFLSPSAGEQPDPTENIDLSHDFSAYESISYGYEVPFDATGAPRTAGYYAWSPGDRFADLNADDRYTFGQELTLNSTGPASGDNPTEGIMQTDRVGVVLYSENRDAAKPGSAEAEKLGRAIADVSTGGGTDTLSASLGFNTPALNVGLPSPKEPALPVQQAAARARRGARELLAPPIVTPESKANPLWWSDVEVKHDSGLPADTFVELTNDSNSAVYQELHFVDGNAAPNAVTVAPPNNGAVALQSADPDKVRPELERLVAAGPTGKAQEPVPPSPAQPAQPQPTPRLDARPKLIKTGELALEVPDYAPAVRRIEDITATHGGFVADASTAEQPGGALSGKVVVRCPPERFEPLFAALKTVGRIEKEDARAADVTAEFVDLQARIVSMQITEDRLQKLIQEKTFLDEVAALLEVERELQRVRSQIEQMQGSLRVMENRIGLSTIAVLLHEPPRTVPAATLFVEVAEVHAAADALAAALAEAGGRMISGQVQKNNDGSLRGEYGLTVSLDRFGAMLAAIQALGRVSVSNISGWKAGDAAAPWADKVPCTISLNLFERLRQVPSGSMTIEVDVAAAALAKIEPLLPERRASIVTNVTKRRGDGSSENELKIRVPAAEYAGLVAAIESAADLGRITAKNIAGEAGAIVGGAAEVLCELTLTLAERTRQLPTGSLALEVDNAVEAVAQLSPIIIGTRATITSNETKRREDGSHVALVMLKVPAGEYAALVAEIEDSFVGPANVGPASRPVNVGPASRPVNPSLGRTIAKNIAGEAGKIVGGAAQTMCDLTITLSERMRQVPAGKMLLQVDKFDTARRQLSALVAERKLQVLAAGSDQKTDGTWIGGFRLGVRAEDMEAVVGRIETLGTVKSRQISGLNLGDLSTMDKSAVGVIEVTLAEKAAIAPPSEMAGGLIRQRLREALEGLSGSLGMILYGLIVIAPWLAIVAVLGWLMTRTLRRRKIARAKAA